MNNNNTYQIIRLEHPIDGIGIFMTRDIFVLSKTTLGKRIEERHIDLMELARDIEGFTYYHYCAYKNIEDLNKWITPEEIKDLITRGIIVLLLDVKKFIEGENQVIFFKEDIVSSKNITSLFE
jgi:hypothetical protein